MLIRVAGVARTACTLCLPIVLVLIGACGGGQSSSPERQIAAGTSVGPGDPMPARPEAQDPRRRALSSAAVSSTFVTAPMVAAGASFSAALKTDGTVWVWGGWTASEKPVKVEGLEHIVAVAAGVTHLAAVRADGTVWTIGLNRSGQLGNGTRIDSFVPNQVPGLTDIVAVRAGWEHTVALSSSGTVWAWGSNASGQLGVNSRESSLIPVVVHGLADAVSIDAGRINTVAVRSDGSVWLWGYNDWGNLYRPLPSDFLVPTRVPGISNAKVVVSGAAHVAVLTSDRMVWSWGDNYYGQLGVGSNGSSGGLERSATPIQVPGLTDVVDLAASDVYTLVRRSDGSAWSFGAVSNSHYISSSAPIQVPELANLTSIITGRYHSLAVDSEGNVWAWGNGWYLGVELNYPDEFVYPPRRVRGETVTEFFSVGSNPAPTPSSNIVFLHGLMGSRLFACEDNGTADWDEVEIWPTGVRSDFRRQMLPDPATRRVYVGPILDEVYGVNIYKLFSQYMSRQFSNWEVLTYDWRQSLNHIVDVGSPVWDEEVGCSNAGATVPESIGILDRVKTILDNAGASSKVTIITHSNGGLVAKRLIQRLEQDPSYAGRVDKLIFVAVPQLGAPQAVSQMMHGTDFPIPFLNNVRPVDVIEVSGTLPAAYQLLPSRMYFSSGAGPLGGVANFLPNLALTLFGDSADPRRSVDDWDKFSLFATNSEPYRCKSPSAGPADDYCENAPTGVSAFELLAADITRSGGLGVDDFVPPPSTKVYQIAGHDLDTVSVLRYRDLGGIFYAERGNSTKGDGTVPYESAVAMSGALSFVVRLANCNEESRDLAHANILELRPLQDLVGRILRDEPTDAGSLGEADETTERCIDPLGVPVDPMAAIAGVDIIRASLGSPADLHIYDSSGAHTGRIPSPIVTDMFEFSEAKIPGSSFQFPHSISAPLKAGPLLFEVRGNDIGVASLIIERTRNDSTVSKVVYPNFPVTPNTIARVMLTTPDERPSLAVDTNNDGIIDLVVPPANTRPPIAVSSGPTLARVGSMVTASGQFSYDPDSGPSDLSYSWSISSGPVAPPVTGASAMSASFVPTLPGTYVFSLVVNDGASLSDPSRISVVVPPLGDIDRNGAIDSRDLSLITGALNQAASGPNDLRDLNGDGVINALDSRKLVTLCSKPRCAV